MAVSLPKDRNFYLSLCKETAFGTTGAVTSSGRKQLFGRGWDPGKPIPTFIPRPGIVTGMENPTSVEMTRVHYGGTMQWDKVYPDTLAWVLTFALGAAPSEGTVDMSGVQHSFEDVHGSHTILSFELQEALAVGVQHKYNGCLLQGFTLAKTVGTPPTLSAPWVAKARVTGSDTAAFLTTEVPWLNEPVYVRIGTYTTTLIGETGPTGSLLIGFSAGTTPGAGGWDQGATTDLAATPIDWSGVARSFTIGMTNFAGVDNMLTFAGSTLARAERDIRAFSISNLILEFDPGTPDLDTYINSIETTDQGASAPGIVTRYGLEFAWQSTKLCGAATYYYGCKIIFGSVCFNNVSYTIDEATGKYLVTLDPTVLHDEADYGLTEDFGNMRAVVWNKVAAGIYGAAPA